MIPFQPRARDVGKFNPISRAPRVDSVLYLFPMCIVLQGRVQSHLFVPLAATHKGAKFHLSSPALIQLLLLFAYRSQIQTLADELLGWLFYGCILLVLVRLQVWTDVMQSIKLYFTACRQVKFRL